MDEACVINGTALLSIVSSSTIPCPTDKLKPSASSSQQSMSPLPPSQDDFELGPAIGFGSTAIVYSGRHLSTNAPVAIKVFDLDRFEQQQIDRLRQELEVMSCCEHENLLCHSHCLTRGNELWVVMPLCGCGSIADALKWSFPEGLEEPVIACILAQTVAGLAHLHSTGHCHRDVKAANLLLDSDGTVRLADFGVSASLDLADCKRRKTFVGTPCWMAPEVMEGAGYDGAKADIWSIGILGLELAYGQAPFAKYPPMKVIYLTLSAAAPPALERERCRYKYSRTLKDFIDSCLQRDPDKRPTIEQLARHPLLRSAKKPNYLVEKLVIRCPPITARSLNLPGNMVAASNTTAANIPSIEWDFSDSESPDNGKRLLSDGCVSRRGRFIVQEQQQQQLSPQAGEEQAELAEIPTNSTIRKGRFSVECPPPQPQPPQQSESGKPAVLRDLHHHQTDFIQIPATQFEQLCLLVDMLKEHVDSVRQRTDSTINQHSLLLGGHRRSSTSLGNARRDSSGEVDRRDSIH